MRLPLRKRVVFVLGIASAGTLLPEGVARLLLPVRTPEPVVPLSVGRFDPTLGWSLEPLSHGVSHRTGQPVEYRINSKGLRDDETSYEKPPGTFRIVLLGDSRTFGFGVPIEEHFSTLLEGYFRNVEVINLGIGGYGIDQELLFLRSEGFRYEPDLVLAYVGHYGAHRHMHTKRFGKSKPRFTFVDGKLVLENCPVSHQDEPRQNLSHVADAACTEVGAGPERVASGPSLSIPRRIHQILRRHSRAYEILRNGVVRLVERGTSDRPKHRRLQDQKNLENEAFRKNLYELGEALVFAMHTESKEHGAPFVLVTQIQALHTAALARQMISVDVSMPLSNPAFSLPDGLDHINESGNGVLTWVIADFLQANHLIPAQHLNTG